jgi:hypothetical protein
LELVISDLYSIGCSLTSSKFMAQVLGYGFVPAA